jgi:hypothetical protein
VRRTGVNGTKHTAPALALSNATHPIQANIEDFQEILSKLASAKAAAGCRQGILEQFNTANEGVGNIRQCMPFQELDFWMAALERK